VLVGGALDEVAVVVDGAGVELAGVLLVTGVVGGGVLVGGVALVDDVVGAGALPSFGHRAELSEPNVARYVADEFGAGLLTAV
jgi:hypothetical protein